MNADIESGAPMEQAYPPVRHHLRFTLGQRYLHAVIFTTFIGLALTGLPLRFSHSVWAGRFANAVGGFGAILFYHEVCAVLLTAAFLIHLGDVFRRSFIKKVKGL